MAIYRPAPGFAPTVPPPQEEGPVGDPELARKIKEFQEGRATGTPQDSELAQKIKAFHESRGKIPGTTDSLPLQPPGFFDQLGTNIRQRVDSIRPPTMNEAIDYAGKSSLAGVAGVLGGPIGVAYGVQQQLSPIMDVYQREIGNIGPELATHVVPGMDQWFPVDPNKPVEPTLIPGAEQWQRRGEPIHLPEPVSGIEPGKMLAQAAFDPINLAVMGGGLASKFRGAGRVARIAPPIEAVRQAVVPPMPPVAEPVAQRPYTAPTVTDIASKVGEKAQITGVVPKKGWQVRDIFADTTNTFREVEKVDNRGRILRSQPVNPDGTLAGSTLHRTTPEAAPVTPPVGGTPPIGVIPIKQPWEMTYKELLQQVDALKQSSSVHELQTRAQILRQLWPEYTETTKPDYVNDYAYGIWRMANQGDEIHRIPTYDLSQRHKAVVLQAISEGRPVPPEVLAEYPDLVKSTIPPAPATPPVRTQSAQVLPDKQPWEMTSKEFRYNENAPKVEAIKQAISGGRNIVVTTHTRATKLTKPEYIRIIPDGTAQIPSGRNWVALTDELLDNTASQAGVKPIPFAERTYHRSMVQQALAEGKPIPANVLAEYPDFTKSLPSAQVLPETPTFEGTATFPRETSPQTAGDFGSVAQATGSNPNRVYEFQYRVVPLDKLITSHMDNLSENPSFPKELQPRVRERAASNLQINQIANEFNPSSYLGDAGTLDRGPMIIGPDMLVESGNGRTLAIRKAISSNPAGWISYQEMLRSNLGRYGLSPDALVGIKNPVLVRQRLSSVNRPDFTREANGIVGLALSPFEQAQNDARVLSDAVVGWLDIGENQSVQQALLMAGNREVARAFVAGLPANERPAVVTGTGELSAAGVERLKNALFAKTYGEAAGRSLSESFTESVDTGIRNIENGMFASLPQMSKMEAGIRTGVVPDGYQIADDLAKAVNVYARLRQNNMLVSEYLGQVSMFEKELTPLQETLLQFLSDNSRSSKVIRESLSAYADRVSTLPPPNQTSMFDMALPSKEEILNGIITARKAASDVSNTPLFGQTPQAPPVAASGEGLVSPRPEVGGQLFGATPGGLGALTPQQPDESDEDYRKRMVASMGAMAVGMAVGGRVKRVGPLPVGKPPVTPNMHQRQVISDALSKTLLPADLQRDFNFAVQQAQAVTQPLGNSPLARVFRFVWSPITPSITRNPDIQEAALAGKRYVDTSNIRNQHAVESITASLNQLFGKEATQGDKAIPGLKFTGQVTPANEPYIGTAFDFMQRPWDYSGKTPEQVQLVKDYTRIMNQDLHFSQSVGVPVGEVQETYITHAFKDPEKAQAIFAGLGSGGQGKPRPFKGRTLSLDEYYNAAQHYGLEVNTNMPELLNIRLNAAANMRGNLVYLNSVADKLGGRLVKPGSTIANPNEADIRRGGMVWRFPKEVAGDVEQAIQKHPPPNWAEQGLDQLREGLLNADFSVGMMRQGWLGVTADPKGAFNAYKDMAQILRQPEGRLLWLTQNVDRLAKWQQYGLQTGGNIADINVTGIGQHKPLIERIPGVGPVLSKMNEIQFRDIMQPMKLNLAEDMLGDLKQLRDGTGLQKVVQGLPLYKETLGKLGANGLKGKTDDELGKIAADMINNQLGGVDWKKVGANPGFLQKFIILTPSWMRNQLTILGNAPRTTPEGIMARRLIARELMAGMAISTAVSLILSGKPTEYDPRSVHYSDIRTKDGWITINPRRTMYRTSTRLLGGIPKGEYGSDPSNPVGERVGQAGNWFEARTGQIPRLAMDLKLGRDYYGNPIDDQLKYVLQQTAPIIAGGTWRNIEQGQPTERVIGQAAGELVGSNVSYNSPSQLKRTTLNEVATQHAGKSWDDLGPLAQERLRRSSPEVQKALLDYEIARKPLYSIDLTNAQKIGSNIENALPANIRSSMQAVGEHVGPVDHTVSIHNSDGSTYVKSYWLPDDMYREYQQLMQKHMETRGYGIIASPTYNTVTDQQRAHRWKEAIQFAREDARKELQRNHIKDWQAESKGMQP